MKSRQDFDNFCNYKTYLRDYYAGQALTAFCNRYQVEYESSGFNDMTTDSIKVANLMIKKLYDK